MPWIVLIHTFAFSLYWLTNRFAHANVNDFLRDMVGQSWNFILVFLVLTAAVGLWSIIQILQKREQKRKIPYQVIGGFYLVFFYGSFGMLFYQDPVQLNRLGQLIQYFRILPDTVILLLLAWGSRRLTRRAGLYVKRSRTLGAIGIILLWLLPVLLPPGSIYPSAIPDKPRLIAHRGASMLAPENTLAAAELAGKLGAYGFETDLRISQDGVLFLMHDDTLARTTNITEVFPERAGLPASSFSLSELEQLNAGGWFVTQDPYDTIANGLVSPEQAESYLDEPIPTFADTLQVVATHNMIILYDLREPPADHPYAETILSISLDELQAANLRAKAWILTDEENIPQVRSALPDATLVAGIDAGDPSRAQQLLANGYQVINSEYALSAENIRAYRQNGLWVNLWTVDEPWQYSRLWLMGASSTTSNNVHTLAAITRPVLALSYPVYLALWAVIGLLAAVVILWPVKTEAST